MGLLLSSSESTSLVRANQLFRENHSQIADARQMGGKIEGQRGDGWSRCPICRRHQIEQEAVRRRVKVDVLQDTESVQKESAGAKTIGANQDARRIAARTTVTDGEGCCGHIVGSLLPVKERMGDHLSVIVPLHDSRRLQ